jgi:hypothetical protein
MYWPDPYTFDPSRFLDTPDHHWNRDAFLPFSTGPRGCIGRQFSIIEATVILAKIMLDYQVRFPASKVEEFAPREGESVRERRERIYAVSGFSSWDGQTLTAKTPLLDSRSFVSRFRRRGWTSSLCKGRSRRIESVDEPRL